MSVAENDINFLPAEIGNNSDILTSFIDHMKIFMAYITQNYPNSAYTL